MIKWSGAVAVKSASRVHPPPPPPPPQPTRVSRRLAKQPPEREVPRFGKNRYAGLTEREYY
jgi:hypothetical protein